MAQSGADLPWTAIWAARSSNEPRFLVPSGADQPLIPGAWAEVPQQPNSFVLVAHLLDTTFARQVSAEIDLVIPRSTILIENPIAIIDTYADKHGTRAVAEEFLKFLYSREAQTIFAEYGLRSLDEEVAKATTQQYPAVKDLWTVQEFGGWEKVTPDFFGDNGIYTNTIAEVQGQ